MPSPSVTYTFSNSTTADAGQVNTNFSDLIAGMTDGTKDFSISALTLAGALTANGNCTFGNATSDTLTFTGYVASDIIPSTTGTRSLGSSSLGYLALYLAASADADTARVLAASHTADRDYTIPDLGTNGTFAFLEGTQTFSGTKTFDEAVTTEAIAFETGDVALSSNTATVTTGVFRITSGATLNMIDATGILASGSILMLIAHNRSGANITINHATGGTSSQQINIGGGGSLTLNNGQSVIFVYDSTLSKWQVVSINS